jgi:GNAT superfamily N-acetyltransferase
MEHSTSPVAPLGYQDVAPGQIASIVTYFEMCAKPAPTGLSLPKGITIERLKRLELDAYRDLFRTVGSNWLWYSRALMSDSDLAAILNDDGVEIFMIREGDTDIGFLELDFHIEGECKLDFIGLVGGTTGRGIGQAVMSFALEHAWGRPISRMWLHTCTFDSPSAVAFYLRSGFKPYAAKIEVVEDPRLSGHLPVDAALHVPMISPLL